MRIALLFHLLGVVIWIGGMFFAYVALRPAAAGTLDPPQRLSLWRETLRRFFMWVWVAIIAIYASGTHMLSVAYGVKSAPPYVLGMIAVSTIMAIIFVYVYFQPFARLGHAVDAKDWKSAGGALNRIRQLVAANLALGLLTVAVAVIGGLLG